MNRPLVYAAPVVLLIVAAAVIFLATGGEGSSGTTDDRAETVAVAPQASATATAAPTPTPPPRPCTEVVAEEARRLETPLVAPLTGLPVDAEVYHALRCRRPIAVMIDNLVFAAPHLGIDRADIVVEALVEGGITRFMAVYHSQEAEVIEPVRSARTPFLYWVLELDAIYAHVGSAEERGDANAGQQIVDWGIADLDSEAGPSPAPHVFERNPGRARPHNTFTSTGRIRDEAVARQYDRPITAAPIPFNPDPAGSPASSIVLSFGGASPRGLVRWDWDGSRYLRSQYGRAHIDAASGDRIGATNIIVQYARAYLADQWAHVGIELVGEGRAQVFRGGTMIEGSWRKADNAAPTRYFDGDGNEIALLPGVTWVEVVDLTGGAVVR